MPHNFPTTWPPIMAVFFSRYPTWEPPVFEPIPLGWDIDIVGALTRLHGLQYEQLVKLTLAEVGARDGDLHLKVAVADGSKAAAIELARTADERQFRSRTGPGTLTDKIDEICRDAVLSTARWCVVCPALCTRRIGPWRFCDLHSEMSPAP